MSDGAVAAMAVHMDNFLGCGGDPPVPPHGDASGGTSLRLAFAQAMSVEGESANAHPHSNGTRARVRMLWNAPFACRDP